MNSSVLPQVTVLLCLSVMVPVCIALIRAELLSSCMHYAVIAQHLIVWLALWVVVDGASAIVAAHLKISVNHRSKKNHDGTKPELMKQPVVTSVVALCGHHVA